MLDNTSNDYLTYERYIFLSLLDTLTGLFFKFVSSSVKRDCSRLLRVVNFKRDSENIFIIFQSSILDPSKFYVFFLYGCRSLPFHGECHHVDCPRLFIGHREIHFDQGKIVLRSRKMLRKTLQVNVVVS